MYRDYFGFREAPFSIAPDPRYLYMSEKHREALAHLLFGVRSEGGFVLLTGEVGAGKTTVCRCLLEQLPENVDVAFIFNPKLTVEELLSTICDELGIPYPEKQKSVKLFVDRLNGHLLEAHARGRSTLLIIDEAQNLSRTVLEQIRLLTNLETNRQKLLGIILLGQPELLQTLSEPKLRQLSQRIIARYHLGPLSKREVGDYINHRLSVAGAREALFPQAVTARIYRLSGGIPRLINLLCDRALLGTYAQGKRTVDMKTLKRAAREVLGHLRPGVSVLSPMHWWKAAAVFPLVLISGWVATHYWQTGRPSVEHLFRPFSGTAPSVHRRPIPIFMKPSQGMDPQVNGSPTASSAAGTETASPPSLRPGALAEGSSGFSAEKAEGGLPTGSEGRETAPNGIALLEKSAGSRSEEMALRKLLSLWGLEPVQEQDWRTCSGIDSFGLRCLSDRGNLQELRVLDLPAVLRFRDSQGRDFFGTLTWLGENEGTILCEDRSISVSLKELTDKWNGDYTLFWKPPPDYRGSIREGDGGALARWVAVRLAQVHGRKTPSGDEIVFDGTLVQGVKDFQSTRGLKSDGVVGPKTLIRLGAETAGGSPLSLTGREVR